MVSAPPRRLLIVTTGLGFGGAEAQLQALARAFHTDPRWRVECVSLLPLEGWAAELAASGIILHDLGMKRRFGDPRAILELARIVRRFRPDVVHAHMVHANLLSRVTRLLAPMPVLVCTAHSVNEGPRWRERAYRITDRLCDVTTQVSEAGARRYVAVKAVSPRRMRVVVNGVDTEAYAPRSREQRQALLPVDLHDRFVFLAVGRLEPAKDYANLVAALQLLRERHPEAAVVHLGTGPLEQTLKDLVLARGLADHFRFIGFRRDVGAWLAIADAMVMSSSYEGLPMVLLEGMSSGLVPVSTAVGGIPEIIESGRTGFLVPPGDPHALADAMSGFMALDPGDRRRLGALARQTIVARYGMPRVVEQWQALYASLLDDAGTVGR